MNLKIFFASFFLMCVFFQIGSSVENTSKPELSCLASENSRGYCIDESRDESQKTLFHGRGRGKWISQIFHEIRENFSLVHTPSVSEECQRDFLIYEQHLDNHSSWAVRMLESSEWPQVGILAGMTYHMGNYDECLRISARNIQGKYCLVETKYDLVDYVSSSHITEAVEWPGQEISVWDVMEMYRMNPVRKNRKKLNWALCVPSSCTHLDLEKSLYHTLKPIFLKYGIDVETKVEPSNCQVKKGVIVYPAEYYHVRMLFYSMISLVLLATIYDLLQVKRNNGFRFLRNFSMIVTCQKLVTFNEQKEDICVHFLKCICTLFIIYGHRFMYLISFPIFDTETMENEYKATKCSSLVHMVFVDAFIYFSGYLTYRFNHSKIEKHGCKELFILVLNRWLRLVPTFSILTLFIAYVLPFQNDGPLWNEIINESEICKSNWIPGFFAVSNIVRPDKLCFWVSWFVSVDVQLTLLGGILILILTKNNKIGLLVSGIIFIITTTSTFITIFKNEYNGFVLLYFNSMQNMRSFPAFTQVYVTFCGRVGPYLMGLFTAMVYDNLNEKKFSFSKTQIVYGSIFSILVGEGFTYYGSVFYDFGKKYSALEHAIYGTFHRIFFVFPFAVIHLMNSISGIWLFNVLAIPKLFVSLSRLSYSVFLINLIIQMHHTYSQRIPMSISSTSNLIMIVVSDIVYSYLAGFLLHIFIEAPLGNFTGIVIKKIS